MVRRMDSEVRLLRLMFLLYYLLVYLVYRSGFMDCSPVQSQSSLSQISSMLGLMVTVLKILIILSKDPHFHFHEALQIMRPVLLGQITLLCSRSPICKMGKKKLPASESCCEHSMS